MKFVLLSFLLLGAVLSTSASETQNNANDLKVNVVLGMHTSFYHSMRGDSPDETGFGFDMRVVRETLHTVGELERPEEPIHMYWDFTVHWTLEKWLREYGQDIINGIKSRLDAGIDEVAIGPYNNGFNSAAGEKEFRKGVELTLENERGSGLKQIFGTVAPIYRPQESVYTYGNNEILKDMGVKAIVLQYGTFAFNGFSNFAPPLSYEQRFNPVRFRSHEDDEPIIILPSISPGDFINYTSFEMLLIKLRKMQERGEITRDVTVHINFDADAETWTTLVPESLIGVIPGGGGITEIIRAVYKYDWANFLKVTDYLNNYEPLSDLVIKQDLADGAYDGMTSWSEKFSSSLLWSRVEKSRLIEKQLEKYTGEEQPFDLNRFLALSTTHFGLMTPVLNLEREYKAWVLAKTAYNTSLDTLDKEFKNEVLNLSNRVCFKNHPVYTANENRVELVIPTPENFSYTPVNKSLKFFEVSRTAVGEDRGEDLVEVAVFIPQSYEGDICFDRVPKLQRTYTKIESNKVQTLKVDDLEIAINKKGVRGLKAFGEEFGGKDFIQNRIRYNGVRDKSIFQDTKVYLVNVEGNHAPMIMVKHHLEIEHERSIATGYQKYYIMPYNNKLIANIKLHYPKTAEKDNVGRGSQASNLQKIDKKWVDVMPFEITPSFRGNYDRPMSIWKNNFMEKVNDYKLEYFKWSENKDIANINNHLTQSWVAISNGTKGVLISNDNSKWSNFAYAPMQLDDRKGVQKVSMNPFGTYYGKQLKYSKHLETTGLGEKLADLVALYISSNAPTYNGKSFNLSLMIAPYLGDEPPKELQESAKDLAYPSLLAIHEFPIANVKNQYDLEEVIDSKILNEKRRLTSGAPATPVNFSLLPNQDTLQVFWNLEWEDPRITHFKVDFKKEEESSWQSIVVPWDIIQHAMLENLEEGVTYKIRLKSMIKNGEEITYSDYSKTQEQFMGERKNRGLLSLSYFTQPITVMRFLANIISHNVQTRLFNKKRK